MAELAKLIEHTILKPDTTISDVRRLCAEAQQHELYGVCVPPLYVRDACRALGEDRRVRVITVVGFPMGYSAIPAKSEEIKRAIDEGADEIDAVINIAAVKSENWNHVERDIEAVARATNMRGRILKLILECGLLEDSELRKLCDMAHATNVKWLKTGTGINGKPASVDMVRQLRTLAHDSIKLKAAGGIRSATDAEALVAAGADRIGTSASLEIIGAKAMAGK